MSHPLNSALRGLKEFESLFEAIERGLVPAAAGGLNDIHKAHIAAALSEASGRPLFVLCADEMEVSRTARDIASFLGCQPDILPARELMLHSAESASRDWEHRRLAVFGKMDSSPLVVASFEAAALRTIPQKLLSRLRVTLRPGDSANLDSLSDVLVMAGYRRAPQVEGEGQFSIRGGILDLFSPGEELPARIEFFGDEVDTIAYFDIESQRRTSSVSSLDILPAGELLPGCAPGGVPGLIEQLEKLKKSSSEGFIKTLELDIERLENEISFPSADRYLDIIYPDPATALDYIPENALVIINDHRRLAERAKNLEWQFSQDIESLLESGSVHPKHISFYMDFPHMMEQLSLYPIVFLDSFAGSAYPLPPRRLVSFTVKQLPSYGGSLETAAGDVAHYIGGDFRTVVLCQNERRAKHLAELLEQRGIVPALDFGLSNDLVPGKCTLALGTLSAGMEYPTIKLAIITEGQLLGEVKRKKVKKKSSRERVRSYADLTPGDYVVHEHHGIGQYKGIVSMPVDGVPKDYIKLQFSGTDILYVPATQLDLVSKYIGAGEDQHVKLNKLGGAEWQKSKSRAKAAAKELAKELIELYAERRRRPGFEFPPDNDWQKEFEESFEYSETEDQLRSTAEIKEDMQSPYPMDRLLCGDVGFGKTEVALRAVMKCVLAGKQAAILVPTTVLAQQHYLTATRRFADYPVNIDVMSRFRSPAQMRETLKKLRSGSVDLLIGTHRILQKDVEFKDLGLLIIDEEQRFGVTHKERLKEISRSVDVLTLSATPIPRTLNMALSGIRDMSSLEEAPRDRHPVQTYVLEYDWGILCDALRRELGRGGQAYYLHNRVESISQAAFRLRKEFPDASIEIAHGQMAEKELNDVFTAMQRGEIDILVCTTIIETGIDIPNVNTLIVEDADKMGLAQLHQLRGRVGRSQRHAYAYLTFRRGKALSEVAEKRLTAIREFAEFGAGFKIAMRDLEIRGAGNILGHAQSGHMMNVGYDMYLKLLEEAVLEERGEKAKGPSECTADLIVEANIPESYIEDSGQRMDLYRRIALVRTEEDASDLIDELCDRYGDIPQRVHSLIRIALLRAAAAAISITEISQRKNELRFLVTRPDLQKVSEICSERRYKYSLKFVASGTPYLCLTLEKGSDPLSEAEALVSKLK